MPELTTLARPYANAAYELAKQADRVDSWENALKALKQITATPEVQELLNSPVVPHVQKAHTLNDLVQQANPTEEVRRFVNLLAANQRLELLGDIYLLFEEKRAEESQVLDITVTTAVAMSDAERDGMQTALKNHFNRDVTITYAVDAELLGGAFIRAGDQVIDGTVRGKLGKMQEALSRA